MRPRLLIGSLVGLAALTQGCAPPRTVSGLGTAPSLDPNVTVREEWKQPATLTVDLPQPAFLTLFVVVPNHGAQLLPTTGRADSLFGPGTHVLHPVGADVGQSRGPVIEGGAYPDLGAACAVGDFVKETTVHDTSVITFATPTTSPPIVTCSRPGLGRPTPLPGARFDRYLLALATDRPVAPEVVAAALERLDLTGSPREVSERIAALAARASKSAQWEARAIRY